MMRRGIYRGARGVLLIGVMGVLLSGMRQEEFRSENSELRIQNSEFSILNCLRRSQVSIQQGADSIDIIPGSTLYLEPNAPNPFGSVRGTTIGFSLDREAVVTLSVYDCFYNLVEVLIDQETREEGRSEKHYNPGLRIASGMYFYTLEIRNGERFTRRMLYLR